MDSFKVIMVGTGNVSVALGDLICSRGHSIVTVAGRDITKSEALAKAWGADPTMSFDFSTAKADLCILAVSDRAIPGCVDWLRTGGMVTVHTAGSVAMDALKPVAEKRGVLYPLQTLHAKTTVVPEIPFLVEGSSEEVVGLLIDFACTLSNSVKRVNDGERAETHLAAVMSSNFINHLLVLTEDYCRMKDIPFTCLGPLIQETVGRAFRGTPSNLQTGPASRNDLETLRSHLQRLEDAPELREIYLSISKSILERRGFDGGSL